MSPPKYKNVEIKDRLIISVMVIIDIILTQVSIICHIEGKEKPEICCLL